MNGAYLQVARWALNAILSILLRWTKKGTGTQNGEGHVKMQVETNDAAMAGEYRLSSETRRDKNLSCSLWREHDFAP